MAYIGKTPVIGNFQVCDALTATTTDTYALEVDSVAVSPQSANHCLVSLNGILQAPTTSFTISGSDIVFASALTASDSIDFVMILGNVLDLGVPSDGTITHAKFDSNTGGVVDWQTVITGDTTMVAGRGYFVNTTSIAITMTLPISAVRGDEVWIVDYAGTFDTNNLTVDRNSHNIQGDASDLTVSTERAGFTLVYVDSTQGWLLRDK
jgi:hypothetical protein